MRQQLLFVQMHMEYGLDSSGSHWRAGPTVFEPVTSSVHPMWNAFELRTLCF